MSRAGPSRASRDGPLPTLSSLLLSTAESLKSRTDALSHSSTPEYLASLLSEPLPALEALPAHLGALSSTLDSDLSTLAFTRYPAFLLSHEASLSISEHFDSTATLLEHLLESTTDLELAATEFQLRVESIRHHRAKLAIVNDRLEPIEDLLDAAKLVDQCVRSGQWSEAIKVSHRIRSVQARYAARDLDGTRTRDGSGGGARGILDRVANEVERSLMGLKLRVVESLGERGLKLPGAVRGVGILRKLHLFAAAAGNEDRPRAAQRADADGNDDDGDAAEDEEEGLRILFLSSRWDCFQQELKLVETQMAACGIRLEDDSQQADSAGSRNHNATKDDTSMRVGAEENDERTRWIKRWIEVWREIVGETIGMYSEVFLSGAPRASSSSAAARVDSFLNPHPRLGPNAPLELFLSTSLASLSTMLKRSLPSLTSTTSLSSLLTQLTYCAHSFSRHGLSFDVALDLGAVFGDTVERITVHEWELAGRAWEHEWRQGWNKSGGTALVTSLNRQRRNGRVPIKDWLVVPEGTQNLLSTPLPPPPPPPSRRQALVNKTTSVEEEEKEDDDDNDEATTRWTHQPNPSLALLPPVAHFVNSHVQSLNALRQLPPRASYATLARHQRHELDRASRVLEAFVDAWLASYHSSTPPVEDRGGHRSTFGGGSSADENARDGKSEEEDLIDRERDEEKRVVATAIAWFGRDVIPWLRDALVVGVYADLETDEGQSSQRRRRRRRRRQRQNGSGDELNETRLRTEKLLARIEGREWVDPDVVGTDQTLNKVTRNGSGNGRAENGHELADEEGDDDDDDDEEKKELPVLEVLNGGPLDQVDDGERKEEGLAGDEPLDFTAGDARPAATDEPSLVGDKDVGAHVPEEDPDAPYLVDDVAPPPPVPPAEPIDEEKVNRANEEGTSVEEPAIP